VELTFDSGFTILAVRYKDTDNRFSKHQFYPMICHLAAKLVYKQVMQIAEMKKKYCFKREIAATKPDVCHSNI